MSWIEYVFIGLALLMLVGVWIRFWCADLRLAVVSLVYSLLLLIPAVVMKSTPLFWTIGVLLILGAVSPFVVWFVILDRIWQEEIRGGG
jgi:hypothetical protein